MVSKSEGNASRSSSFGTRGSKAAEIFDEDDSLIVVPPCLSKAQSKPLEKGNPKLSIGSVEQDFARKEARGAEEDLVITCDSKNADEVSQMHSFEMSVDDSTTVEASLEITYENYVEFEEVRNKRLQKIVEGSEASVQATCNESEQELDIAEDDQMDLKDSDSVPSKQSAMSKLSISSNRSVSSMNSKKVGLFGKKDKRSVSGQQDDGSAASKRSVSSKHSIRSGCSKKDKGSDASQQDNGRITGKRSVSSKHSKRSVRSASSKQDKHSVTSEQNIASVSTKESASSKQETAQGQQNNASASSKLSKRLTIVDKEDNGFISGDLGPAFKQGETESEERKTPQQQQLEDLKAMNKLEMERMEHQVKQIKAALIKRKKDRARVKETAEQRMKKNIKILEAALATRKKAEADIEAEFVAHLNKARSWQKPKMPVSPKDPSEDLQLPPPSLVGPNLHWVEVEKVEDTPWYVKMFSWQKPQTSDDKTKKAPSSTAGEGSDSLSAKCDEGSASIDQTKKAAPNGEDKAAPIDDTTVATAWKELVDGAEKLRFTFTEGPRLDRSKAEVHQNTSVASEKTGSSSRFSQFKDYILKRKKSIADKLHDAKNELAEFAVDLRESFSGGGDDFDFSTAVEDSNKKSGDDNSTVATTEKAGNDPATAKDSGSKVTTASDEEEDASQTSNQVGKVVSFDVSTVDEKAIATQ